MIYIYGLYLQGVCHYVGASADPFSRYVAHRFQGKFKGKLPVLRIFRRCQLAEASRLERQVTLAFHRKGQAKLSKVAGGYHSTRQKPVCILKEGARPYEGELLSRKSFISARCWLCLSKGDVAKLIGVTCTEMIQFERGDKVLPFEVLGRYADLIRQLSKQLERGERTLSAAKLAKLQAFLKRP